MFKRFLSSLLRMGKPIPLELSVAPAEQAANGRASAHIGHRRQLCYWEPIFDADIDSEFELYDWDTVNNAGPCRRFIHGPTLLQHVTPGDTFSIKRVTFKECDFQGTFSPETLIMFEDCAFNTCDFAYSRWKHAHFKNCKFTDSSISLSAFERCEFSECTWERLGFGSKTEFHSTFVRNPASMINSTISKTNSKDISWRHKATQWYRLHGTRAHVLRTLMISH